MKKQGSARRLPSIARWIMWVIIVQLVLFNISAALYAHKFSHFYNNPALLQPRSTENVFTKTWRLFGGTKLHRAEIERIPSFPFDTVTLKTGKGIFIDAWYAKTDSASKGTVLLFHPVTVSKSQVLNEAAEFRFMGYNVLLVEFRAHGNSGGSNTTLGVKEAEEIKLGFDYVRQLGEKNIILWGSSMGAVAISKGIADYQLTPTAVILEMPFASLQSHLRARARLSGFSGFPEKPFAFFVTLWMGVENGYNGFKHKTTKYVKDIHCPVLLQWGALDASVLKDETDDVYNSIGSTNKKLVIYPTAAHESMLDKDPIKWRIEVARFLSASIR